MRIKDEDHHLYENIQIAYKSRTSAMRPVRGFVLPFICSTARGSSMVIERPNVVWFEDVGRANVALVGGKSASLGEMIRALGPKGIRVPPGFATTSDAYWCFLDENNLRPRMDALLADLSAGRLTLPEAGKAIRTAILQGKWPSAIAEAIVTAYRELCRRTAQTSVSVAVRSSATAEDLPQASFAGQQESYLNIRGEQALLDACQIGRAHV